LLYWDGTNTSGGKVKSQVFAVALLGAAVLAGPARATIINFDNLSNLDVVTNQYAGSGVLFSGGGGDVILVTTQPTYNGTKPNLICTGPRLGPADCTQNVILNFTTPVDNLNFDAFGNATPVGGTFALADVFQNNSATATATNIPLKVSHPFDPNCAVGTPDCDPDHQNLSAYSGITELLIHNNTDPAGTAYDTFSFTQDAPAPEPSTLFLTGLCGIVWAGRRFLIRHGKATAGALGSRPRQSGQKESIYVSGESPVE
jgi:hypothetical protein